VAVYQIAISFQNVVSLIAPQSAANCLPWGFLGP